MSAEYNHKSELWNYIFGIFPLIDLPFGILCVILSDNWIFTLCFLPVFPLVASGILVLAAKHKFDNPGAYIFAANGTLYMVFQYFSGVAAPGWCMLINVTVGSSFMFAKPLIGQLLVSFMATITGSYFYLLGATWEYSLLITLVLLAFTVLFSRSYSYLNLQQQKIQIKNKEIEAKNKDITDSIHYAQKIQQAVLPIEENIQRSVPLDFILFKPKDIVSGDFYWFHEINSDEYIIIGADCTGHGVPGAFMTVIGSNILNHIIIENKVFSPGKIIKQLDERITTTLKQEKEKTIKVQDGMDCGVLYVNKSKKEFIYAGAKRSAYFISENVPSEIKSSKLSVGGLRSGEKNFEEVKMNYKPDDIIYLYTDGYADQFGGEKSKKYSTKRLKEDLLKINEESLAEQKNKLENNFMSWKNNLEQIDDVCIIGIRF
jgi:serine phosphatase RsbU (regulator of sigma subunit)